jgi:multiple sugar transport system permease protein
LTGNSLLTSAAIRFVTTATSALAGYAISRMDFRGRRLLSAAIIGVIIIPPQLLIVPLFRQLLAFTLVGTYWGVNLRRAFPPAMVIIQTLVDQIPIELDDAARVDGGELAAGLLADRVAFVTPDPLLRWRSSCSSARGTSSSGASS